MLTAETLSSGPRTPQPNTWVRVWDPLLRLFHWTLAAGFATCYLVEGDYLGLHVWTGYLVLALILFRVIWGLAGPRGARWSDFVQGPSDIAAYLADVVRFRADRHLGHNPAGGAMAVALLLSLGFTGLSGLALYGAQELAGPLAPLMRETPLSWGGTLKDVHELLANTTIVLVVFHLAGVALASLQHRENLVLAMITGNKRSDTT